MSESRFDRTADRYLEAARSRDWSALIELCRPLPDDRALDVGAGPGLLSAALAPRVARAVALDPSRALLERAPAGVETVEGSGEAIPFGDGEFDLVTAVNTLHHVDDMAATLAEMVRVLAPAGRIVVQDYLADPDPAVADRWELVERLRDPDHRRLPEAGEVERLLAGHGLRARAGADVAVDLAARSVAGDGGAAGRRGRPHSPAGRRRQLHADSLARTVRARGG